MKKVLLTNAFIKNYSGSELDTVEVANYFLNKGYKVDIFTLEKGEPLLNEVNKNVRVLTHKDVDKLYKKYDILWSHHYPLVDYLLFYTDIKFDYVHHLCLSFYEAYEQLPIYYEDLNLVSAMSEKCRDELISDKKNNNKKEVLVFPNYAKLSYFNKTKKISNHIKKIAIVSNHIPEELLKIKSLIEQENIILDIYGQGYNYVKIDEKILLEYDVIISIGKTCYYSIALGIPTYIYDRFGGDGYITPKNINKSYQNNFSGRAFRRKLTANEIKDELISEYEKVVLTVLKCKDFAFENFCFENNMEEALSKMYNTPKFDKELLIQKYPHLVKTGKLFVEQVGICKDIIEQIQDGGLTSCQLFYDTSNGFNEKESIRNKSLKITDNKYEVEFILKNDCQRIRFDICEKKLVEIKNIIMNGKKIFYTSENIIDINGMNISLNNDPYIIINKEFKKNDKVKFNYELVEVNLLEICNLYKNQLIKLTEENQNKKEELTSIKNSRSYKIIRKISRIFRRG